MQAWMPGVLYEPTAAFGYPDFTRGSMKPIAVMSHIMQGYQRTMRQWAAERPPVAQKSAHFTIGRDGLIVQHVGITDAAWAAGVVAKPTWRLLPPGGNPNRLAIHIEHEGFSTDPGYGYDYVYSAARPWPAAMVAASIRVHAWVMQEAGIRPSADTVIGHFMTDGVNRINDPGAAWPRYSIIGALLPQSPPVQDPVRPVADPVRPVADPVRPVADPTAPLSPEIDISSDAFWAGMGSALLNLNGNEHERLPRDAKGRAVYQFRLKD